jgi:hypothetical protein
MRKLWIPLTAAVLALGAGCAGPQPKAKSAAKSCMDCGRVTDVQPLGGAAGASRLPSTRLDGVGGPVGGTVGGVGGAAGGILGGASRQLPTDFGPSALDSTDRGLYRVRVAMDSGGIRSVTTDRNVPAVGQRVRVVGDMLYPARDR